MKNLDRRLLPVQVGIICTFALIPVWYRLPQTPPLVLHVYFTRFLILLPMLCSIVAWGICGLPGFNTLRRDIQRSVWLLALLSLALWMYASQSWAFVRQLRPEVAQNASLQFCVVALFVVVLASAAPPPRVIVGTLLISLLWNALVAAGQVSTQGAVGLRWLGEFPIGINQPGISVIQAGDLRWLRPYGLLPHPNILAGVFAVGLLAATAWLLSQNRWQRYIALFIFLFGLWVFMLTFSRGAWLGFGVGAFAIFPLLLKRLPFNIVIRRLLLPVGCSLLLLALFFALYRPFLAARAGEGDENVEMRSVSDRLVFTEFAYRSIQEQMWQGVGAGNFPWRAQTYLRQTRFDLRGDNVHNVLLSAWAELGIVGFVLMLAALILGMEAALRNANTTNAVALIGGFLALTTIGILDHYPYTLLQFQTAWWGLLAVAAKPAQSA